MGLRSKSVGQKSVGQKITGQKSAGWMCKEIKLAKKTIAKTLNECE